MNDENSEIYKFLDFRFDYRRKKLWKGNELITLPLKALELLSLLLEKNGDFVTKQEIFEKLWNGTFVEDGVLTQNIYTLRKILGNDEDGMSFIENKKGFGYRITFPINTKESSQKREFKTSPVSKNNLKPILFASILVLVLGVIGLLIWKFYPKSPAEHGNKTIDRIKFTKLTDSGKLTNATLSPDGKSIAFIRGNEVFLQDVATRKEIKIEIPNVESYNCLQFSPDGNFLYFRNNRVFAAQAKVLKVSRFGGESQTVLEKSWGSFSISPDGKKIAYFLNVPPIAKFNLKVKNLETGAESEFFAAEQPNSLCLECSPAWSPDGSKIVFPTNIPNGTGQLFMVDQTANEKTEIKLENLKRFEQAIWLPNGKSFIVSATEGGKFLHLWKVSFPDYKVEPLTNGLMSYTEASVSADGKFLLALQSNTNSNIFVADGENLSEIQQITSGNQNYVGQQSLDWIDNDKVIFSSQTANDLTEQLNVFDLKTSAKTLITEGRTDSSRLPTSDGNFIWFVMNKNGFANIYQMDLEGKNLKQLTNGTDGQRQSPQITNDSKFLYYIFRGKNGANIRRFNLQTNTEEIFFDNPEIQPQTFMEISPDNKYITFSRAYDRSGDEASKKFTDMIAIVSLENPKDVKIFPASLNSRFRRFSPNSKAVDWISADSDGSQLVRQEFEQTTSKPFYSYTNGTIFNFAWSKDGKKLAISQGVLDKDAILLSNFD
ncbi:MAG: winged helix-turn-helix domain-containing protein [Pyrinomonadaceae bacterium]|nr:winged helix-turn-helix domain-containing protein [Pyrinomonadaceae bacterium]